MDPYRAHILIVDDSTTNIAILKEILQSAGFQRIDSLVDPRLVMESFGRHDHDLILLDLEMPHMNGIEVLEALTARHGHAYLPVVMVTAHTERDFRLKALSAGAKDFISKPLDPTEVLCRVGNVLIAGLLLKEREQRASDLEHAVRDRTRELDDSRLHLIRTLGRAGEYRDNETGRHILRISRGCGLLSRIAGLGDDFARAMQEASPMHDVGKIGIPDAILLKPGRLEPHEMEIMKRHPEIGARILHGQPSPLLDLARSVALTHHERWDGTGYPHGLAGEAIPIEGRIVAVCDVFDALISPRPYKKAWSVADAAAYIRENSGKHFDPRLADLFIDNLSAILHIYDQFPEHLGPMDGK